MKRFISSVLIVSLIGSIEMGRSIGATILPILASLILWIWSITFWISIEKKYTVLFVWAVSIYMLATITNVLLYN